MPGEPGTSTVDCDVLVGFAEAESAPEVVWSLVDAGARVSAFARRGVASPLRHSRHVVCHDITPPEKDAHAALLDLQRVHRSVGRSGTAAVLFPLDDTALWLCNGIALEPPWTLAGPQGANAELALNKGLQVELARECGFNVPESAVIHTGADAASFAAAHGLPIILKSSLCVHIRDSRRHRSPTWICANERELDRAVASWGQRAPLLAQRYIVGTGEGVFGLGAIDGVRGWSAHRRLRMMNPEGSGSSACVSADVPTELKRNVSAFVQRTGWRGLFMIELLRDTSGKIWFVELNGRPWGSMALARRQGLEYPAWHLNLALDERSDAGRSTTSMPGFVCRHLGRELMHLLFVLRGPKSKALGQWPSFWTSLVSVIAIRPRDGIYNWRRSDPSVFVADVCYTLQKNLFKART
jgi:predicted ATP-grasp superfamily ATP-dependent carboligase